MNFSETKSKNFLNILLSSIFAKEVSVYPPIKQNANGAGPPNLHYATRKFQKKIVGQAWKITNFDRQAALFDGDSMEAITYRFSEVRQVG